MQDVSKRQLYLWQGIIIYVICVTLLFAFGNFYKDKFISYYYNRFNQQELNPVSNQDRLMMALENKIQDNPTNPNDYLQLGWIYHQKGASKEAIKVYLMALNLQPDHAGALYNIGLIYAEEKEYAKAEHYYKKILAKHPDHELAGLALVKLFYDSAQYNEADKVLTEINSNYFTNADYFYYQGLVTEKLNRPEEAVLAYRKALSLDPDFKEAKARLHDLEN